MAITGGNQMEEGCGEQLKYSVDSLAVSHVCKEGEVEFPADLIGCVGQKWVWGQGCI